MDAAFTEEQDETRRTVRELLARRCRPGDVRSAVGTDAGYDETLWQALTAHLTVQLGGEQRGSPGKEGGAAGLAPVFEEAGRALLPSPLLATAALAAPLVAALGTQAQRRAVLPKLASGERTAALAVPSGALPVALGLTGDAGSAREWAGGGRAGGVQARPDPERPGGWRLYGECGQVLDGHSAGLFLVAAHAGGFARSRTLLFLVDAAEPGLVRVRQQALDETRAVAGVELREVRAELLGESDERDVCGALARLGPRVAALLAVEAVGAADSALTRTVAALTAREQAGGAGAPSGASDAVRDRLADVYVQVRAARSAAYYAAWAVDAAGGEAGPTGPTGTEAATAGGLALAQGLEALRRAAGEAVQAPGAVGLAPDHEAQMFFRRAAGDDLLFGPVHRLRAHAAERADLFTSADGTAHTTTGNGLGGAAHGGTEPDGERREAVTA